MTIGTVQCEGGGLPSLSAEDGCSPTRILYSKAKRPINHSRGKHPTGLPDEAMPDISP